MGRYNIYDGNNSDNDDNENDDDDNDNDDDDNSDDDNDDSCDSVNNFNNDPGVMKAAEQNSLINQEVFFVI